MTYKCPKCGNAIEEGINPCPNCRQQFVWDSQINNNIHSNINEGKFIDEVVEPKSENGNYKKGMSKSLLVIIIAFVLLICAVLVILNFVKKDVKPKDASGAGDDTSIDMGIKTNNQSCIDLSSFDGKLLKPYMEIIASGNYYFKISSAEGGEEEMFTQIGKDKMISIKNQGYDFIKKGDGTLYCVTGSQYVELNTKNLSVVSAETAQLVDSLKLVFDQSEKLVSDMVTMTPTDKASSLSVKDYQHEEYIDEAGVLYSFFFDKSNKLVAYAKIVSQEDYSLIKIEIGASSTDAINKKFDKSDVTKATTNSTTKSTKYADLISHTPGYCDICGTYTVTDNLKVDAKYGKYNGVDYTGCYVCGNCYNKLIQNYGYSLAAGY